MADSFLWCPPKCSAAIYTKASQKSMATRGRTSSFWFSSCCIQKCSRGTILYASYIQTGDQDSKTVREKYKGELLRFDYDGAYSLRTKETQVHFGFNQLTKSIEIWKMTRKSNYCTTFWAVKDMWVYNPNTGKIKIILMTHASLTTYFLYKTKNCTRFILQERTTRKCVPRKCIRLFDAYDTTVREGSQTFHPEICICFKQSEQLSPHRDRD